MVKITKFETCKYCGYKAKKIDTRHYKHCFRSPYFKNKLKPTTQNRLGIINDILLTSKLYLPSDLAELILKNGEKIHMGFIDGNFVCLAPEFARAFKETPKTMAERWRNEKKKGMISYPKKITYKRLSTEFGRLMKSAKVGRAPTYILLREDDMIYLASIPSHKQAKLSLKELIAFNLKAKYWITDLIYKLGKCNNREFKFLCAWLRLGYALEEIIPQQWYRLPNNINRRIDFRLHNGELLVEIDDVKEHDRFKDITTDREFFEKNKLIIRFGNREIDDNALKVVRQTINIAKKYGVFIKQEVLPEFIKGFIKNKVEDTKLAN